MGDLHLMRDKTSLICLCLGIIAARTYKFPTVPQLLILVHCRICAPLLAPAAAAAKGVEYSEAMLFALSRQASLYAE